MSDEHYLPAEYGEKLAAGLIQYEVVDGIEAWALLSGSDYVVKSERGFLIDYDFDGEAREIIEPLGIDFDGDGVQEWGLVVQDNNLQTALDKPFANYTVSEAMLFFCGLAAVIFLGRLCWRRFKF